MVVRGSESQSRGNVILNVYRTELSLNTGTNVLTSGYYGSSDGYVSGNKKVQDSYFYQDFSYVITSEIDQKIWDKAVHDTVHPAGTIVFGQGILQDTIYGPSYGGHAVNTEPLTDGQIGSIIVIEDSFSVPSTKIVKNYSLS